MLLQGHGRVRRDPRERRGSGIGPPGDDHADEPEALVPGDQRGEQRDPRSIVAPQCRREPACRLTASGERVIGQRVEPSPVVVLSHPRLHAGASGDRPEPVVGAHQMDLASPGAEQTEHALGHDVEHLGMRCG